MESSADIAFPFTQSGHLSKPFLLPDALGSCSCVAEGRLIPVLSTSLPSAEKMLLRDRSRE